MCWTGPTSSPISIRGGTTRRRGRWPSCRRRSRTLLRCPLRWWRGPVTCRSIFHDRGGETARCAVTGGLDQLHPVIVHHLVNSLGWQELRPLQDQAAGPVLAGADVLLLAPTAGGKTEAAVFPLLTAMATQRWSGLSLIYVCPLKALLNNLSPRLDQYAGWLGRRVALWHGDVPAWAGQRILRDPPALLLTTPESLEAMLISVKVQQARVSAGVQAVVVDELH